MTSIARARRELWWVWGGTIGEDIKLLRFRTARAAVLKAAFAAAGGEEEALWGLTHARSLVEQLSRAADGFVLAMVHISGDEGGSTDTCRGTD